jgi:single-strand DNA-binding protein
MQVFLTGRLATDPELRYTSGAGGSAFVRLRVAENRRFRNRAGEWQEESSFYTVKAWDTLAENVAESLSKGDRVVVTGEQVQETWTDRDGNQRDEFVVRATEIAAGLKFATVQVHRTARPDAANQPNQPATVGASAAQVAVTEPF